MPGKPTNKRNMQYMAYDEAGQCVCRPKWYNMKGLCMTDHEPQQLLLQGVGHKLAHTDMESSFSALFKIPFFFFDIDTY
jgi:hypothetical protein